jgi:signal transduction histidine kinase
MRNWASRVTKWLLNRLFRVGTIRTRLLIASVFLAMMPILAISIILGLLGSQYGQRQAINYLELTAKIKEAEINAWVDNLQTYLETALIREQVGPRAVILLETPTTASTEALELRQSLQQGLRSVVEKEAWTEELFLIDLEGQVILSTNPAHEGQNHFAASYFQEALTGFYLQPPVYSLPASQASMIAARPVLGSRGNPVGVLAGRVNPSVLNEMLGPRTWFGNTGEIYLLDQNRIPLTTLRFGARLKEPIDTEAANAAIETQSNGSGEYDDYRGVTVIGLYHWMPELQVALVAKQDQTEALGVTYSMLRLGGYIGLGAIALAAGASLLITQSISEPLSNLAETAAHIAAGELELVAPTETEDEIGALARSFNSMTSRLRDLINSLELRIAELRQAQEDLEQSHERLITILDSIDADIYVADLETYEILFMNQHMRSSFGDNLVGRICWEVFRGELGPCAHCTNDQLLDADGNAAGVVVWDSQNPITGRWYINYDRAITWLGDRLVRLQVAVDITERVQAEKALRQYTAQLEALREVGLELTAQLDLNSLLQSIVSRAVELLQGTSGSLYLHQPDREILEIAVAVGYDQPILGMTLHRAEGLAGRVWETRSPLIVDDYQQWEGRAATYEGYPWTAIVGIPIQWGETFLGVLNIQTDAPHTFTSTDADLLGLFATQAAIAIRNAHLHEQVQRQAAELEERVAERTADLAAVNRELEAFAYSVSHDLRAPLRSVDGFSQALLEDYVEKLDPEGQDYLRRVRVASQRMGQLIDHLLMLSRLTRREMLLETIDLSTLVQEITAELQEAEPGRQVEFVIQEGVVATGDIHLLRIMLDNLLSNAWKFTSKQPQARIEFGQIQSENGTVYFVRDDGVGFDMAYADKLFGAFQRLHALHEFEGTGIGLATVQRVIHRHGGQAWAEGTVGEGATFYFTL